MFKFSYNWLKAESEIGADYDELLHWLDIQGFEIASIEDYGDDKAVEIEVKANRPDMLSVAGVLREFYAGKGRRQLKNFTPDVPLTLVDDNGVLSHKIDVKTPDVHRYCAVEIRGVDNTGETPAYIKDRLTKSGVACINPIVDISNYVLLQSSTKANAAMGFWSTSHFIASNQNSLWYTCPISTATNTMTVRYAQAMPTDARANGEALATGTRDGWANPKETTTIGTRSSFANCHFFAFFKIIGYSALSGTYSSCKSNYNHNYLLISGRTSYRQCSGLKEVLLSAP